MSSSSILVIDVGTSGLRAGIVRDDASIDALHYRAFSPDSPFPGLVEFDAAEMARHVLDVAHAALDAGGPVAAVGITNQRASTIVWDRRTGQPLGPALGWQDLRTVTECIVARSEHGLALAPNQTATKAAAILGTTIGDRAAIASRARDVCVGTVDSWIVWTLTRGALHVTDHSNAAVTGLCEITSTSGPVWHQRACSALGIPMEMLANIVTSSGPIGEASALPGSPMIASIVGDQQASLLGQSCVRSGMVKSTFGTGGMMNVCLDSRAPTDSARTVNGTFPIVAWSKHSETTSSTEIIWGAEAIMLSAGTNIEWLRDDLGLIESASESHEVAQGCSTADGVVYVPALLGLGTPSWDYGARGTLLGLTRGSTRSHVVRAVLEGIAHRGADLLESLNRDHPTLDPTEIRIDGGMSRNPTFVQALADALGRPVAVSPVTEATTLGAAYLAGLAVGTWSGLDDIDSLWSPLTAVDPDPAVDRHEKRREWTRAVTRAAEWIPELSALDF
jgi:glycerol kinase